MGRDVDSTIYIPQPRTQAGSEIADVIGPVDGDTGLDKIFSALNTLYENMRGQVLCDYDPDGIIDTVGDIALYRTKTLGEGGLTDETVRVWAYLLLIPTGPGPWDFSLKVTEKNSTNTFTYQDTSGGSVGPTAAIDIGSIAPEDTSDFNDWEFEITVATSFTIATVIGLSLYYEAPKSALTAVSSGESYANGVVPLEISQAAGEKPNSTHRLMAAHQMAVDLFERRLGQIGSFWVKTHLDFDSSVGGTIITSVIPPGVTVARFYMYARTDGIAGVQFDTLTISAPELGVSAVQEFISSLKWYGPLDLALGGPFDAPWPVRFNVTGSDTRVHSICGFFRQAAY